MNLQNVFMNKVLFIILMGCLAFSFSIDTDRSDHELTLVYPEDWPEPVYDFRSNPITENGFKLGRALFHDQKLSRDGTISCASCHSQYNAFTHVDHNVSHGIEDRKGTRNSPALINLAWNRNFHWDGGVNNLEMQPLNPLSHHAEMDNKLEDALLYLNNDQKYRKLFFDAFGDSTVNTKYFLKAIAQYTASLVSANSDYDKYKRGEIEFNQQQENGYTLFKKHCDQCHTEPLFCSNRFANNGLGMDSNYMDVGRYKITNDPKDSLQFKIPTLRNIAYTFPYMHDGRFSKLKQVMNHYVEGIDPHNNYLSDELKSPIKLNGDEQKDLIAFLLTLSDKEFMFNRRFNPRIE